MRGSSSEDPSVKPKYDLWPGIVQTSFDSLAHTSFLSLCPLFFFCSSTLQPCIAWTSGGARLCLESGAPSAIRLSSPGIRRRPGPSSNKHFVRPQLFIAIERGAGCQQSRVSSLLLDSLPQRFCSQAIPDVCCTDLICCSPSQTSFTGLEGEQRLEQDRANFFLCSRSLALWCPKPRQATFCAQVALARPFIQISWRTRPGQRL